MIRFNHFNFNVLDLQKSLDFYREALELAPVREKNAADGSSTSATGRATSPSSSPGCATGRSPTTSASSNTTSRS